MPVVSEDFLKKASIVAKGYKELYKEKAANSEKIAASASLVADTLVSQGHITEVTKAASIKALMGHETALKALNDIAQKGISTVKSAQHLTVAESMGAAADIEKEAGTKYVNANTGEELDETTVKFYKDLEVI